MERYLRQTLLSEIGHEGQKILSQGRVLCVGAGGLGSPAAMYLVAAGIGTVGLIDGDQVDLSNLQRQVLFTEGDIGLDKVEAAASRLRAMSSDVKIEAHPFHLSAINALDVFRRYDVIVDGTDNFSTKFLINDACLKLGLPLVYGSISQFDGQISVFWKNHGPCYRCLHPKAPSSRIPNCAENGVIGSVAGVIGSMMSLEAMKLIFANAGFKTTLKPLLGSLLTVNLSDMDILKVKIPIRQGCLCSHPTESIVLEGGYGGCELLTFASIGEISEEELNRRLESGCTVIDVREEWEWLEGHIWQSRHWALSRMAVGDFPSFAPKTQSVVVVCHGGVRSVQAAGLLLKHGYSDVRQFSPGVMGWAGTLVKGYQ